MDIEEFKSTLPANVKLIAVSKTQTIAVIEDAIKDGQMIFGENKIQEAEEKFPALKKKYPNLQLHFIGHLQSNKASKVVELCDVIHSVDSIKLADELAKEMQKQNRNLPCFIQVNTGDEEQKGGVAVDMLASLYKHATDDLKMNIVGLMCIPPANDLPDMHFALLHKLSRELNLKELSMGMSADYERAIKYGATYVRIGTSLFGEREKL